VGIVGDRPQQREKKHLEEDGEGDDVREERPGQDGDPEWMDVPRGSAAARETEVRYGPVNTVTTVVVKAEFAKS
jgi:hypothetical protein